MTPCVGELMLHVVGEVGLSSDEEVGITKSSSRSLWVVAVNLLTAPEKVSLMAVVCVRMELTCSFRVVFSWVRPDVVRRGSRSSDAIMRACSRRRTVLYRALMSV